jgi:hypothetical protein
VYNFKYPAHKGDNKDDDDDDDDNDNKNNNNIQVITGATGIVIKVYRKMWKLYQENIQ